MAFSNPSVQDFKDYFNRDYPYGTDINTCVLDSDITKSFMLTNVNFNPGLWADQGSFSTGFLLLSAHYLVTNLRASSQGLNGQYNFLQAGKGAGAVNESFSIPQRILDNPDWAMLTKTNYGAQYLQLVIPQMAGQMFNAYGRTLP